MPMLHSLTIPTLYKTSLRCMPIKSNTVLVDSHVHVDDTRLMPDRESVLDAARNNNIAAQIVPAVSRQHWPRLKLLCDANNDLYPCYGLHPGYYAEHSDSHIPELSEWLGKEPAVAVGECGLDYAIAGADKAHQQQLFSAQLALAREFNLPIVIHAVKAVEDVIRMIRASGHYRGMVHSFNGSAQQASRLIDLGYMLSFGGAVTYSRAKRLQTLVTNLPLDGQRNEPAYLVDIWQSISALRSEDAETIAAKTTENACQLFDLPAF